MPPDAAACSPPLCTTLYQPALPPFLPSISAPFLQRLHAYFSCAARSGNKPMSDRMN